MKTVKNNSMKNISKNVIVAFAALALTFATSCKKPSDDPTPSTPPTNNGGGGTNTAPTVTITPPTPDANGTIITVDATDIDGIKSVVITRNGASTTLTSAPFIFNTGVLSNGNYTYDVVVTDNNINHMSTTQSVTFTVSNGTVTRSPKEVTESILSDFYGIGLSGIVGTTTISSSTFTTTGTQPSGGFFTTATSAGTYNYVVNSNGSITLTANGTQTTYDVQVSNGALVFTGNKTYTLH